jgi:hypothetical protein
MRDRFEKGMVAAAYQRRLGKHGCIGSYAIVAHEVLEKTFHSKRKMINSQRYRKKT